MNTSDVSIGVFSAFLHHLGPSLSELIGRFPLKSNEMLVESRESSKLCCEESREKVEHHSVNVFKFSPFLLRISPVDRKVVIIPYL